MERKAPVPRLPGGPDPTQPVPREPVEGVDLRGCAGIAAELAAVTRPRGSILAQHRLDELRWAKVEKTWMLRLATAMLAGDLGLAQEYDAALTEAQDALVAGEPGIELDTHAAIIARLEAGHELARVLAETGIPPARFARAQRAWARKLAHIPALSEELRRRVAAERARLG